MKRERDVIFLQNLKERKSDEISKSNESPSKKRKSDESLKRERKMKVPQNQKWESIKGEELNKELNKKNEFTQRNNLNEIKRDKWEGTFKKPIQKQALIKKEKAPPMFES